MKNLKLVQLILASVFISGVAIAAPQPKAPETVILTEFDVVIPNAPAYYPEAFQLTGIMRSKKQGRKLEISGIDYVYGINTPVHSVSSEFASIGNITEGSKLGFSYVLDDLGQHLLTEIWIIPDTAIFSKELDQ